MLVVTGMLVAAPAPATAVPGVVKTADMTKFQAGNIISDAVFSDAASMTEAQIQTFLNGKVGTCRSGYVCLKNKKDTTRAIAADPMCKAYAGGGIETAARIIYKVAQACGVNPQVLLTMLEKEQSLVTDTWPVDSQYRIAMGQGCPDTAACDSRYFGFFNQVHGAAWQLKRYGNPPGTSNYFTWYAPGKTWNIRYHPNVSCGSSPVYIANKATSALYYYTPYQPNAASLRAVSGTGDACSSYGNRNFYRLFTDWFGSTQHKPNACVAPKDAQVTPADGEVAVTVSTLNARIAPTVDCELGKTQFAQGAVLTRTGTFGGWTRVRVDGTVYWVSSEYLAPAPAVGYTVDRLQGANRIVTAVEISKRGFPDPFPAGTGVVFVASGAAFPDALTASAAAASAGASLLVTGQAGLPGETRAEILRLNPARVVVLGGPAAISDTVVSQLRSALPSAAVERVGGINRFDTSRLVATQLMESSAAVYLATGVNYPDALSAAAAGAAKDSVVLLVDGRRSDVDAATLETLESLGTKTVYIVGGEAAVPAETGLQLRAAGYSVYRVWGDNRFLTNLAVNAQVYRDGFDTAFLATGRNFPDAVAGAVLSARLGGPLLLEPGNCMTRGSKDFIIRGGATQVTLLGGSAVLSDAVARSSRC